MWQNMYSRVCNQISWLYYYNIVCGRTELTTCEKKVLLCTQVYSVTGGLVRVTTFYIIICPREVHALSVCCCKQAALQS